MARVRVRRNSARVLVGSAFVNCSFGRLSRRKNHISMDLEEGSNWLRIVLSGGRFSAVAVTTFRVAQSNCFDSRRRRRRCWQL